MSLAQFVRESSIGKKGRLLNWRIQVPPHAHARPSMILRSAMENEIPPSKWLPSMPSEVCLILKYLVEYLLKHKLHKNQLFVLDGKPTEKKKLLSMIKRGDLPSKLSQYSSSSLSFVVRHLLEAYYAPLFPYDVFEQLETLLLSAPPSVCIHGIQSIMNSLAMDRRALLESLLLLLYKLSLKATAHTNVQVLGEVMGVLLMRPTEDVNAQDWSVRRAMGIALIQQTPLLLQATKDKEEQEQARDASDSAEEEIPVAPHARRRSLSAAAATVSIANPSKRRQSASAAMQTPRRLQEPEDHDQEEDELMMMVMPWLLSLTTENLLDLLQRLWMQLVQSSQEKKRLFLDRPVDFAQERRQMLQSLVENRPLPSELSLLTLAMVLKDDLLWKSIYIKRLSPFLGSGSSNDDDDVAFIQHMQTQVASMDPSARDLLLLLCASVRLVMEDDAQSIDELAKAFHHCLVQTKEPNDLAIQLTKRFFLHMHETLKTSFPSPSSSPSRLSWRRESPSIVCMLQMLSHLREETRAASANRSSVRQRPSIASNAMVSASSTPLDALARLYQEGGDLMEIAIIVDKVLRADHNRTDSFAPQQFQLFTLPSIAMALKTLLQTKCQPLVQLDWMNGTHSASDWLSELNMWRFEAQFLDSNASVLQKQMLTALFQHLELILLQQTSQKAMQELYEAVASMVFHVDASDRDLAAKTSDFCRRLLQTKFFSSRAQVRPNKRKSVQKAASDVLLMHHEEEEEDQDPNKRMTVIQEHEPELVVQQLIEPVAQLIVQTKVDLVQRPSTLSEFLLVRWFVLEYGDRTWVSYPLNQWTEWSSQFMKPNTCLPPVPSNCDNMRFIASVELHSLLLSVFEASTGKSSTWTWSHWLQLCQDCQIDSQSTEEWWQQSDLSKMSYWEYYAFLWQIATKTKTSITDPTKAFVLFVIEMIYPSAKRATDTTKTTMPLLQPSALSTISSQWHQVLEVGQAVCKRLQPQSTDFPSLVMANQTLEDVMNVICRDFFQLPSILMPPDKLQTELQHIHRRNQSHTNIRTISDQLGMENRWWYFEILEGLLTIGLETLEHPVFGAASSPLDVLLHVWGLADRLLVNA